MRRAGFWIMTVAAVMAVAITLSLGRWQMGRAATKIEWQEQKTARQAMPVLGWADLHEQTKDRLEALQLRTIRLEGVWLHEATVYLDNRSMSGQTGFIVVTPLINLMSRQAIWVQRGWVPRHLQDRTRLPPVPLTEGVVEVSGVFVPPPSKLFALGAEDTGAIRQNIDIEAASQQWQLPLVHASVQQTHAEPPEPGLRRDWPVVVSDVHKHYGYAVQWFSLSALILLLYVWFQIIAPRRRARP
jgi:surfeit locus 1 family protein